MDSAETERSTKSPTRTTMSQRVSRQERGSRIERTDVSEGDTVVMEWSPYGWYEDEVGTCDRITVEVTDVCTIGGDIILKTDDGEILRDYGEGRRYVSGRADFQDGVPDRTDVGIGAVYYDGT